jgi:hypothetical protein
MKLTEAIEGDDVEKFNQSLPMIVAKLRGLTDGVITIDDVLAKNPTQGTIDNVPFISECVLILWVDTKKLYPQLVNDVYNLVGREIQGLQFGGYPFKLGIFNIEYIEGLFRFTIDADNVSRDVYNHLKYDLPTIQQILSGEYSYVLPEDTFPKPFEGMDEWVKILGKIATTYYNVFKVGNIRGIPYELIDNPIIRIEPVKKTLENKKDLSTVIYTSFKNPNQFQNDSLKDELKLKFIKFGVSIIFLRN